MKHICHRMLNPSHPWHLDTIMCTQLQMIPFCHQNHHTSKSNFLLCTLKSQHALYQRQLNLTCTGPSHVVIEPNLIALVTSDIEIKPMSGTYTQVATSQSFDQKGISTLEEVVDPAYRVNITIIMNNPIIYIEQNICFPQLIMK